MTCTTKFSLILIFSCKSVSFKLSFSKILAWIKTEHILLHTETKSEDKPAAKVTWYEIF